MKQAEQKPAAITELRVANGGAAANAQKEEVEVDLVELFFVLLGKLHYIVVCALAGALIFNLYSFLFIHPTYQSTSSIYIVSASSGTVVDLTDLNIGNSLKNDYQELILSYPVLDRVSEELDLGYDTKKMRSMITITNPTDTRLLKLTVTAETPEEAMEIANALAEVSVEYLPATMNTDAPNIAQRARLEPAKTGPSYTKNTAIGFLIGLVIACAIIILRHLMDDTIRSSEDMENYFGTAPLATIPYTRELDSRGSKHKRENGTEEGARASGKGYGKTGHTSGAKGGQKA